MVHNISSYADFLVVTVYDYWELYFLICGLVFFIRLSLMLIWKYFVSWENVIEDSLENLLYTKHFLYCCKKQYHWYNKN